MTSAAPVNRPGPIQTITAYQAALRNGAVTPELQAAFLSVDLSTPDVAFEVQQDAAQAEAALSNLLLLDSTWLEHLSAVARHSVTRALTALRRAGVPASPALTLSPEHDHLLRGEHPERAEYKDDGGEEVFLKVFQDWQGDVYFSLRIPGKLSKDVRLVSSGVRRPQVLAAARILAQAVRDERPGRIRRADD